VRVREPVEMLFPGYSRVTYRVLKVVLGGILNGLYDIEPEGLENVPESGPAILAANHVSFLDSFFIPLVLPRRVTYLAKAEYWDSWRTRWFFESVGQIPVRRQDSEKARAALDAGLRVLDAGGLLGIYPEGTRSLDGRLYKGRTGVARMAQRAGCPVIPIGLVGSAELMPKGAKLPKRSGTVRVRFGRPLWVPPDDHGGSLRSAPLTPQTPLDLRSFVDGLMYEIMCLSGQEYVDRYADRGGRPAPDREPVGASA
jgi:1-acyl-sn-glycerol-3-phosphate acyltransferase